MLVGRRTLGFLFAGLALIHSCDRLLAQTNTLSLSSLTATPGSTVTLDLTLSTSGTAPAALQWTLGYAANEFSSVAVTAGPAATAASKTPSCSGVSGQYTCVLTGLNTNTLASGVVANVQLTLASNATPTTVTLSNPLAVGADGTGLTVSAPGSGAIAFPDLPSALVSGVACNPTSLGENSTSTCTITLTQAAPTGGASVTLASNNTLLTVPPSVTVSAGAASATFTATTAASLTSNQSATVTATLGSSSQTATISLMAPGLVSAVACNPTSLAQSASSICTVTLSQVAPIKGSSVTLASSNGLLTVPASVTVPAGAATAIFTATAAGSIVSNQSATVTATVGSSSQTATINLTAPVLVSGVACNPASLNQSATTTCTVTLTQPAPPGGSFVTLASNNGLLSVLGLVIVPTGAATATFTAVAAAFVSSNQSATVTATLGSSSQTALVSLMAPGLVSGVACNPTTLGQSATSNCTVTLTQAAPASGSSVNLASNNTSLTVPSSVTVSAGATIATFTATAAASIAGNQSATVTATFGSSSQTATISLMAPVLVSGVACNPTSLNQSATSSCTVTLTQVAPTGGSAVTLASNNTSLTVPPSVTVSAGATTAGFTATAAATIASNQSATVTVTLSGSSKTATISLFAPVLVSGVACNPTSLTQSATSSCTVTLTQAAPTGGSAVTLASNNASLTVPPSVTVTAGATAAGFTATAAATIASNQTATVTATLGTSSQTAAISLVSGSGSGGGGGGGGGGGPIVGPPVSTLSVTPASLTFNATPVNPPASQSVTLTSTIPGTTFSTNAITGGGAWLSVSPASGATDSQGTLAISADPTGLGEGMYTGTVNILTSQGGLASVFVILNIQAQLTVSPTSFNFTHQLGIPAPGPQGMSVFSNPSGLPIATAVSGGNWLTIIGGGATPATLKVAVNPNLAAGTYSAMVAISSAGAATVNVPVNYTVINVPSQLSVPSVTQNLTLIRGSSPATSAVNVANSGGGMLQFTAQAVPDQGNWLTLPAGASGGATPSTPAALAFAADPTGLDAGLYMGHITVQDVNSSAQAVVNITMAVSQAAQSLQLSESGLAFSAVAGGSPPPPQSFTVSSQGAGSLSWTAQAQTIADSQAPSADWLSITPAGGSSLGGQPGSPVTVSVNPANLPPGEYYGSVNIAAPNAVNNPQSISVLLNVKAASQTTNSVGFSTGGVILSGPAGGPTPQQQQVSLFNPSNTAIAYSTTVFTSNGVNWLSASPASGTLLPGSSSISIAADLSSLPSGVETGTVTLDFADGTVGIVQVAVIAMGGTTACAGGKPGYLVSVFRQPLSNSVLQAAVPQTVQLQIADDCSNPLAATNGGVAQVSFGNRDAPLTLHDIGGGIWEGTWTPANAAPQAALQAVSTQTSAGLSAMVTTGISVTVLPAAEDAPAQISGVVNAAGSSQATPQIVTPGGFVAIYGASLAAGSAPLANTIPLPTTLNGTQLLLGNQPLPLLYAGAGQVNALIPQNLNPNTSYQLVVQRGSTRSVPVPLTVAGYQPGIYTRDLSGKGQGVVEIAGTTMLAAPAASGSRPAQRGSEYLVIFATGLGPVTGPNGEAPPADGVAAPLTTVYQTTAAVSATVGGVDAPVLFSGLTPSLVGLYQVNIQVPASAPAGDAVPLTLTVADPSTRRSFQSNTVTIALQ